MNTAHNIIPNGTRVSFQYRRHQILGGELVQGFGVVMDRTVVGGHNAYSIRPDVGGWVHVRFSGVRAA